MGHPPRLTGTTLACLLLVLAVAESASRSTCTVGCRGMHPSKAYQEGHTYVYSLEGMSVTSVTDAQGEASLKLAATVELSMKPDCVGQLRLKDVQINGAAPSTPDIEQYAVQFNYHNGHIDTQLCTQPGDSQESLNIKRAVVSLLQTAVMEDTGSTTHHETDVMGSCPTEFNFRKEGDTLIVNKNKDLSQCAYRENVNLALVSGSTDTAAGLKTSPLLSSRQEVEQRYKRGVLNKVMAKEVYNFRPFSNGNAGAKTTVETTLTLKSEKDDNPTVEVSQPKSLIFEAPQPTMKYNADDIGKALQAAKSEVAGGVKTEAAEKFAELIRTLRRSSKKDMLSVYQKIRAGSGFDKDDQKLFLDALFRAGNGEAAEMGVELIKNKDISGVQSYLFYASLALIRYVQLPSVVAVASLLDQPNLPKLGYLGVGQVIGKYCQDNPCENVPEVKQAVHKIREKVGNGKAKTREQENQIISAMKALGNSQFLDDATLNKLAHIAADKNVRNRVRVAAIEALPTRCSMKWKTILFKVLADREEDSEVRIKSYLSLVACPCPHVANQLKETLDKEVVNQVGSFIQSHLRNLRASTDPSKLDAKNHLGLIKPRTKFPEDVRKFSFNNELSYKLDSLGIGSTMESNVIYSQNSFVPRSTNLNMTMELFGRNFNFLELNTRMENLDRVIEHYLGPKGKLREMDLDDLTDSGTSTAKRLAKYIKERYDKVVRGKREVKQGELDKFAKNVHLRNNEVDQDLDVDLSVKLFGVELAYLSYQGDSTKQSPEAIIDKLFDKLQKGFDLAKNLKYDFENYFLLLDSELIYPTGLGAALNLGVMGTSALRLKTQGKIDLQAILADPKNANFRVGLDPSVSVRVVGNMIVQAPGAESGMKLVTNLHTATSVDLSVSLLDGSGIDINVGVPKKKQELISVSSEVLLSSGPKGNKYVPPKFGKGKEYSECFDKLSTVLGITVCGSVSYPYKDFGIITQKALFPLSGPSKLAVTLEYTDVSSYHFKVNLNRQEPQRRSFEILLDTPNSKTNRRVSMVLEAGLEPNIYGKIALDTPVKKASLEIVLKNNAQEISLSIIGNHDRNEYFGRIGMLANGNKYKPVLEYKVPKHIEKLASSKTGFDPGQQYELQGTVEMSNYHGGQKYVFDKVALVVSGQKLVVTDGSIAVTPNAINMNMKLGYVNEELTIELDSQKSDNGYKLSLATASPSNPQLGIKLNSEFKKGDNDIENHLTFSLSPHDEENRLSLDQKATVILNRENLLLSTSNELKYPAANLKLKYDGKLTSKSVNSNLEVKYKNFTLGTQLSGKLDPEKPGDYEVELEGELMKNSVELKAKRQTLDAHKNKYTNSLKLSPGGKYSADALVTYDVHKNNVNLQLEGDVDLNGKKVRVDTGLEANPQLLNSNLNVKLDGTKYIEFMLKAKRSPNVSGTLVLNLKNYLTANGQFDSESKKKRNMNLVIDMPKIKRKIKAVGNLEVSEPQYTGNFELLYDADNDPSKLIKLSTSSQITEKSLNTKNVIEVLSYKLLVNAKGDIKGDDKDEQLQLHVDVTLPNKRYLVYEGKRSTSRGENKYSMQIDSYLADYEQASGPVRKLSYNIDINSNNQEQTSRNKAQVKFVDTEGKTTELSLNANKKMQSDKKEIKELSGELKSDYLSRNFQIQLDKTEGDNEFSYNVKLASGDDFLLTRSINQQTGNENEMNKLNSVLEVKLPYEKLSQLKLEVLLTSLNSVEKDIFNAMNNARLTYNNDRKIEMDFQMENKGLYNMLSPKEGKGKLTLNILDLPRLEVSESYKYDPTPATKSANVVIDSSYGNRTFSLTSDNKYLPNEKTVNLKAKANFLLDSLNTVDLQVNYKRLVEENKLILNSKAVADGKKYALDTEVQNQDTNNYFHVTFKCPKGKTQILSKFQKLSSKEYKGELKVETPKDFVVADAHVDLESVDNFVINANFDSNKATYRKIHAEISNKPAVKLGKSIHITVTSDGKNIVTGSTSYKQRDEDGKIVVEGNGNLKVGENTRNSSFKYTRQQLKRETDGEVGVAMVLNSNFGPSAIVGELKLTNKEVHVFNSYCEQSKDCAQFKLQSILNVEQESLLKHEVTLEVDLKKFNVPAEFGLKTTTELKNPIFDHITNIYVHSSKDKSEYTYQLYIRPKESATILALPSREMAAVLMYDLPKSKHTGAYKMDLSLYLDRKNKPAEKTSLSLNGDVDIVRNSQAASGEIKFTYPTQTKDMLVKGSIKLNQLLKMSANLDIDVFAKRSQKITISANIDRQSTSENNNNITSLIEVNSRGQQLKLDLKSHVALSMGDDKKITLGSYFTYNDVKQKPKTLGGFFSADCSHMSLVISLPDKELLRDDLKMQISRNVQKIDREATALGDTQVLSFEANDLNRFKLEMYLKENPNNKLSINGQLILGQLGGIHVDTYKDGAKKNLFHVLVHLDEKNFLKPDISYNKENVAEFLDIVKNKNNERLKKLKDINEYVLEQLKVETTDLMEHLKKAQPNMKPLMDYYETELNKMKEEMNADETVKEIQATLNKYFGAIITAVTETMKQVAQGLEKLQQQLNVILTDLKETVKAMYPKLKESYNKIFKHVTDILDAAMNLTNTYLKALLDQINKHQKEIHDAMSTMSVMSQDFAKIIIKGLEQIKQNLNELVNFLEVQLKTLPIYDTLKEKLQELKNLQIPDTILIPIEEMCRVVKNILPTEDLRKLADLVCEYVIKHIKREKVDEINDLKKIYSQSMTTLQSTLGMLEKQVTLDTLLGFVQIQLPTDLSLRFNFPIISTIRVSVLNLLRNEELPSPLDLYYAYRPSSVNLKNIVPPFSQSAVVTSGGHFFTFDGRYVGLSGDCSYILAQDMQDGNFSVVANFQGGSLTGITLTEPKESITLKSDGSILVNNKPADVPASTKNLHAYLVPPFNNVKSDYGVRVTCSIDSSMVCAVHVSGFYLGKIRGLLGDANNEPYDDYTLPSGKITDNEVEFGNAYRLKDSCTATANAENAPNDPTCTEYFARENSPLKPCFNYVNRTQYREACNRAAAGNTPAKACTIATAYHYACYAQGLMSTRIPSACTSCKVGDNKIDIGNTFSVKTPKNQADVIFVVEQQNPNEKVFKDMVQPLMTELRDELKQREITDVHIGLIGYSENMKWPQHYTVNGNTDIQGEVKNMKFDEKKPAVTLEEAKNGTIETKLNYLHQKLDVELGTFKLTDAYEEAIRYPFRVGAAKAVVGVIANPCAKSPFIISLQQIRLLLGHKIYRDLGLTYYHVSYPGDLLVSGKPQKNIVGYDQDSVYTFADSKKKPLTGSTDMKSNLSPTIKDVCADFAVSSGGATFSSNNFLDAKPNQKRQFVQVVAKRISDGLVNLELQQDCLCNYQYGMTGRPQCKIVGRNESPRAG